MDGTLKYTSIQSRWNNKINEYSLWMLWMERCNMRVLSMNDVDGTI